VKNATLPSSWACSMVPGGGGSLEEMSRGRSVRHKPSSMFMAVTEKLASLLA
jgi:hypothetical protein